VIVALAAALLAAAAAAAAPAPEPRPERGETPAPVAAHPLADAAPAGLEAQGFALTSADPAFGGLSGVAVSPDGTQALLLGDRGSLWRLDLLREDGRLTGVANLRRAPLRPPPDDAPGPFDTEGLAVAPDGALLLSLEGPGRLWRLGRDGPRRLTGHPDFPTLQRNSGLEALAAAPDGALYAIAERSGAVDRPFPVYRRDAEGRWEVGALTRRPPHLPTGADIGPDGALYVLERDFSLFGGFAWRLSRVDLAAWPTLSPQTLAADAAGFDNMEGVSVWRDGDGALRAVLVADDNFNALQRSTLVELVLPAR